MRDNVILSFEGESDENYSNGIPGIPVMLLGEKVDRRYFHVLCCGTRRRKRRDGGIEPSEFISLNNVFVVPGKHEVVVGGWRDYSLDKGRIVKRTEAGPEAKLPGIFYWVDHLKERPHQERTPLQKFMLHKFYYLSTFKKRILRRDVPETGAPEWPKFLIANQGKKEETGIPRSLHADVISDVMHRFRETIMGVPHVDPSKIFIGSPIRWAAEMGDCRMVQVARRAEGNDKIGEISVSYQLSV